MRCTRSSCWLARRLPGYPVTSAALGWAGLVGLGFSGPRRAALGCAGPRWASDPFQQSCSQSWATTSHGCHTASVRRPSTTRTPSRTSGGSWRPLLASAGTVRCRSLVVEMTGKAGSSQPPGLEAFLKFRFYVFCALHPPPCCCLGPHGASSTPFGCPPSLCLPRRSDATVSLCTGGGSL